MSWIDVHTHLDLLDVPARDALAEAWAGGIDAVITIGTKPAEWDGVFALAREHAPRVGCALGVHPNEAAHWDEGAEAALRALLVRPEVVAVGEIGLDYHFEDAPRALQIRAFRDQLGLATEFGLPVEIHTRDAEADTAAILRAHPGDDRGLLHCFTGTQGLADAALASGYDLSISGVVTFKNAGALRDVVATTPIERLHVETDAPFLAPVPFRGRKNRPALVAHTAAVVAGLKGVSIAALAAQLRANAMRLFPRMRVAKPGPLP